MTDANPYYRGPQSDHFKDGVFFNPGGEAPRGFIDLLKWQFGGGRSKWPASWPEPLPPAKPERRVDRDALRVTMVGHASLLIQASGLNILTDPVWSERVSPLSFAGPRRVSAPGIAFEDLPPIDLVLVSHNHYDHLDTRTLARLHATHEPRIVTPLGNDTIIKAAAPAAKITAHDWGDRLDFDDGVAVHVEPAHHWSARGTRDRRMALWSGFVIDTPSGKIYFAGDTGFQGGHIYRALAEKHGAFRLAILPIGAYEPRWFMEAQHQNPEEAVRRHATLQCRPRGRLPLGHVPAHRRADRRAAQPAALGPRCTGHRPRTVSRHGAGRSVGRAGRVIVREAGPPGSPFGLAPRLAIRGNLRHIAPDSIEKFSLMASAAPFAKMNGLGNEIIVADMRGRADRVTPAAAVALNGDPATKFDQIMAIHDPRTPGTANYIEILNSDGSMAQACGNGMRCVVQALAAETGQKLFTFETVAGILNAEEHADGHDLGRHGRAALRLAGHPARRGVPRHAHDRVADRADRRAAAAFALGRHHGQSACDLLGRRRCLELRRSTASARCSKTIRSSRNGPTSRSRM